MKVPLVYPKIPSSSKATLNQCVAFEKYDGTNCHWVWSRQQGFTHFGTRRDRFPFNEEGVLKFTEAHEELFQAPYLFQDQLQTLAGAALQLTGAQEAILFTEFFGEKSFAGKHLASDTTKKHIIIDIILEGKLVNPQDFLKMFPAAHSAKVIFQGKYTGSFVEDVRKGRYKVNEGVVCKGLAGGLVKVKTDAYLKRLQENFSNWEEYWE